MLVALIVQNIISAQKCYGYLFRKIAVTAPQVRLQSLCSYLFRFAAAYRFLILGRISMIFTKKHLLQETVLLHKSQYKLLL